MVATSAYVHLGPGIEFFEDCNIRKVSQNTIVGKQFLPESFLHYYFFKRKCRAKFNYFRKIIINYSSE
jgi:hypothetical protein